MAVHQYQAKWDHQLCEDLNVLIKQALQEDLESQQDWTTVSIVPAGASAVAHVVARDEGIFVGEKVAAEVLKFADAKIDLQVHLKDGSPIAPQEKAMTFSGDARQILSLERTILNFAGRLSGIASKTRKFVDLTSGTKATICDTRKTTPGWRRIEKYAVNCGGGTNHRMGLYDAILIKDNHLAFSYEQNPNWESVMKQAIRDAKKVAIEQANLDGDMVIQVEVDNLQQLDFVLEESPDIVLLDNMNLKQLAEAVAMRDKQNPKVLLEASGGVNIDTVASISQTGVERISIGALTHSAVQFDLGLDWEERSAN